jgi:hypothetical protein
LLKNKSVIVCGDELFFFIFPKSIYLEILKEEQNSLIEKNSSNLKKKKTKTVLITNVIPDSKMLDNMENILDGLIDASKERINKTLKI